MAKNNNLLILGIAGVGGYLLVKHFSHAHRAARWASGTYLDVIYPGSSTHLLLRVYAPQWKEVTDYAPDWTYDIYLIAGGVVGGAETYVQRGYEADLLEGHPTIVV